VIQRPHERPYLGGVAGVVEQEQHPLVGQHGSVQSGQRVLVVRQLGLGVERLDHLGLSPDRAERWLALA
jgi:hypothetical protein